VGFAEGDIVPHKKTLQSLLGGLLTVQDHVAQQWWSPLSMQRMLEIKTYKTVWTMGHKIRKALADRDANYKLAGLIEMDDTYFGAPKPRKRGRGAAGKAKVVVAVETPEISPDLPLCIWSRESAARRFRPW
jgi:hypothetical protein